MSCSTYPHNNYIQLLVEAGIFGFIPFLLFSIIFFYKLLKVCFQSFKLSNQYSNQLIAKYTIVLIFENYSHYGTLIIGIQLYFSLQLVLSIQNLNINIKLITYKKIALITGITGQDGSYLAEFLYQKGT